MSHPIIKVSELSKVYQLGEIGMSSFKDSLFRQIRRWRGKPLDQDESEFWALRDLSFEVQTGEVLGIIGKNGAGKSTLLKLLSRITEPSYGEVRLRGRVASLLEVGTGFHQDLTGRENIYLNGTILGMKKREIDRKLDAIIDFSGVEKHIDTPVKRYSSGMNVRLGFAVAAHLEPEILIIDEVLAVGDAEFQNKCIGKMKDVAGEGRTVLFVSHNMTMLSNLCSRAIMLESGCLAADGKAKEVVAKYLAANFSEGAAVSELHGLSEHYQNDFFAPESMSLVDEAGNTITRHVERGQALYIEISGNVTKPNPYFQIGYALVNSDLEVMYWTTTTDVAEEDWLPMSSGFCRLRSKIPTELLNRGDYRLDLFLSNFRREWVSEPGRNSVGLSFTIGGSVSDSPCWRNNRPGKLAPTIPWHLID